MTGSVAQRSAALTIEALLALRRCADVELSPDGERVAFTVSAVADDAPGRPRTRLWLGEVDGELAPADEADALTEAIPRFSPDGARLAYASDAGHPGRMSVRLHGAGEVGSVAGSVEDMRWSPDGSALLVLAADVGSDRAGAQTATRIREGGREAEDPRVLRPARHWRRLFLIETSSGATREVSPDGVNVFEFDWAGGDVAAVCSDDPSEGAWYEAWIGLIDVGARTVRRVHRPRWQLQQPRISPGGRVAWIEGAASDRTLVTGVAHVLGVGTVAPELDLTWLAFADETTLWYAGRRGPGSMFGRVTINGAIEELHGGELVIGTHVKPQVSPGAHGERVAAVVESAQEPPELVLFERGRPRTLTALNAPLRSHGAAVEWHACRWAAPDGLEIEGLLALPAVRDEGAALPLVVAAHGGPTATWTWAAFSHLPYMHPLLLAQEGWAVLLPNPRGSAGRGQAFARANVGDLGGADLQDVLAGVDALVERGIADATRVAITGVSYGGYLSSWAVTQTDRFAAAVPCAVHTNWLSFHLTTNIPGFDRRFMRDDPYDPGGDYVLRSPVYHARRCTTPTLILHGEEDLCTPLSQAVELYSALIEAGCEAELAIYPREGHVLLERAHRIDAWERARGWLTRRFAILADEGGCR